MNISKIVTNSFKYPFRNIKKLPILCILFVLVAIIPIGMIFDNRYISIIGFIAFFAFILIVPGYLMSFVQFGLNESSMFPSISIGKNIYNSIKLLVLRIVYMLVPAIVFFITLSTLGASGIGMLFELNITGFVLNLGLILLIILIVYILFEILLFFAKARLAYLDSLPEALKMHRVVGDIRRIGVVNIIKWILVMAVLMVVVSVASSVVMMIPYVGFLIYLCIVVPIMESIGNYSLGLLYSNIIDTPDDLDRLDREIAFLKYRS